MATTAQLRASYPEFITRWPTSTTNPRCDFSTAVPVVFPAGGPAFPKGYVTLKVHPKTRQIWRAVAAVMLHFGYRFEETAGGTLSCRKITGGTGTTLHAHGLADDHNPSRNRYRYAVGVIQWGKHTDMPAAMVRAIEAITLTNGRHPIEWGGRWWNIKDPMHYEIDVLSSQLAPVNLATLPAGAWTRYLDFERTKTTQPKGDDPMLGLTIGPLGADVVKGPGVRSLQIMLLDRGYKLPEWGADGGGGDESRTALRAFQADRGMVSAHEEFAGGIVGDYTYAWLHRPTAGGEAIDNAARASASAALKVAQEAKSVTDSIRAL